MTFLHFGLLSLAGLAAVPLLLHLLTLVRLKTVELSAELARGCGTDCRASGRVGDFEQALTIEAESIIARQAYRTQISF